MLKLVMEQISYDEFAKIEFRVGEIVEAKEIENSEKLIRMVVDFGDEFGQKIVFSGIRKWYSPEELLNKKTVFIVNMIPKKIMGEESQAMIFAGQDEKGVSLLFADKDLVNGSKVF